YLPLFLLLLLRPPPRPPLFPYTTLFRSEDRLTRETMAETMALSFQDLTESNELHGIRIRLNKRRTEVIDELNTLTLSNKTKYDRSEEHTSELQSRENLVCRLLLEKKKKK